VDAWRARTSFGAGADPEQNEPGSGFLGSAKHESKEAGGQQHKPRCGQNEKAIGDEIVITHGTPAILDRCSSEFIKSFGIGFLLKEVMRIRARGSGPRAKAFQCMGRKNSGADQTHNRRNCLNHRERPLRPCARERTIRPPTQSKGFLAENEDRTEVMIWSNRFFERTASCPEIGRRSGAQRNCSFTNPRRLLLCAHVSPFPPCSGCDMLITSCGCGLHMGTRNRSSPLIGMPPVQW
jgi:hypothetical protein